MAQAPCVARGQPIGYEAAYYELGRRHGGSWTLAHSLCWERKEVSHGQGEAR